MIYDDDHDVCSVIRQYCERLGFEVVVFDEPVVCPLYGKGHGSCLKSAPCADVMLTDLNMPKMSGIELIRAQSERGCKLGLDRKVMMSGTVEEFQLNAIRLLGCVWFEKTMVFPYFIDWLKRTKVEIDLTQPLGDL